jgi:hypothetical protein
MYEYLAQRKPEQAAAPAEGRRDPSVAVETGK